MAAEVEHWLQRQLGAAVRSLSPVGGGCIHRAWRVVLADGQLCFAKTNAAGALPLLEAEADGLKALAAAAPSDLVVPMPLAVGVAGEQAVLVLPWLELGGGSGSSGAADRWFAWGRSLACLHRSSLGRSLCSADRPDCYGWASANFIGTSPQPNRWSTSWASFFVEQRLEHQLQLAASSGLRFSGAEQLLVKGKAWLEGHVPEPVLVHGDLWSGNGALLQAGGGALFDPAVHRADREVDLAMACLFGGFPVSFFEGYQQGWPLSEGHEHRRDLYNLYHLLNHANLFGGGYRQQAQQSITALLSTLI